MKIIFAVLCLICFAAAAAMYYVGSNSSHLSELKDFFWVPIPLGIISLLITLKKQN